MSVRHDTDTALNVEHDPARLSATLSLCSALLAIATSALVDVLAIPVGLVGISVLAAGVFVTGSRTQVSLGVGIIFVGVLAIGASGGSPGAVLVSATASIVAWDIGRNAISIGEHLGTHSDTHRTEIVHAATTVVVSTVLVGVAYGIYAITAGGQPVTALVLLLLGAILLIWTLRS